MVSFSVKKDVKIFIATLTAISVPVFFAHVIYSEQQHMTVTAKGAVGTEVSRADMWSERRAQKEYMYAEQERTQYERLSQEADRVLQIAAEETAAREAERQRVLAAQAAARAAEQQRIAAAQAAAAKASKKSKAS